jgi:putative heme-binding domain-containing protein
MLWWALETKFNSASADIVKLFDDPAVWKLPMVEQHLLERVMRRFAAEGGRQNLMWCARLLQSAPDANAAKRLLTGFEQAFSGRPLANLPPELVEALAARGGGSLALRLRQGQDEAVSEALDLIDNPKADRKQRLEVVAVFGEVAQPRCVPVLLQLLATAKDDETRHAALAALKSYPDAEIGNQVAQRFSDFSPDVRDTARTLLASRAAWALMLLKAVEAGKIEASLVPTEVQRRILSLRDDRLAPLVRKLWGEVKGATTAEMNQQIERLAKALNSGDGTPYPGKKLFLQSCAKCHQLFGQGGNIGPDLTTYQRNDVSNLLLHVVNPSAEIREGFENHVVATADGRVLNGFVVDKDPKVVVLRGADGQNVAVPRDQVEEISVVPQSLMPEGLLKDLTDQQVRDLFAYLRTSQPLND